MTSQGVVRGDTDDAIKENALTNSTTIDEKTVLSLGDSVSLALEECSINRGVDEENACQSLIGGTEATKNDSAQHDVEQVDSLEKPPNQEIVIKEGPSLNIDQENPPHLGGSGRDVPPDIDIHEDSPTALPNLNNSTIQENVSSSENKIVSESTEANVNLSCRSDTPLSPSEKLLPSETYHSTQSDEASPPCRSNQEIPSNNPAINHDSKTTRPLSVERCALEFVTMKTKESLKNTPPDRGDNDIHESESVLSAGDSADETFDENAAVYDDSDEEILPGARRPYHGHSDDDEEDEDDVSGEYGDEDFDDSDHAPDADSHYSDAEDPQSQENETDIPSNHCSQSASPKAVDEANEQQSPESPSENKESELDADQDKTNPAYIPRTGRYFMHDYREAEEDEEKGKSHEGKSRSDTRKWQHDRFRFREQAPRSRAELIRKYGYDIRKEDAKEALSNHTEDVVINESQVVIDRSGEPKVVANDPTTAQKSSKQQHEPASFTRGGRGRIRSGYRSTMTHRDAQVRPHGEVKVPPQRPLRGRFTVGQRRPAYSSSHRGRSEPMPPSQGSKGNGIHNHEGQQLPGYPANRGIPPNSTEANKFMESKNTAPKHVSGRQTQHVRNADYPIRGNAQQSHPSRRSFTRPRGNFQKESASYSGHSAPVNAQSKYQGQNQFTENIAPRARDDYRPSDQGPKRYSALRQTASYRTNPTDSSGPPRSNERPVNRSGQQIPQQYSSRIQSSVVTEDTYTPRRKFAPVTDGYGNPANVVMDDMVALNRTGSHFHSGSVSYPLESTAHPYPYNEGPAGDPCAYPGPVYPQMAPVDMYTIPGTQGYSETIPVHPYMYGNPMDAYTVVQSGVSAQPYNSSSMNREHRPLLGRRPLKPLEIKDPRDRCQSTSTGPGQNTEEKGKPTQDSWSSVPAAEVSSKDT